MIIVACCIVWQVVWVPVRLPRPAMRVPPAVHETMTWTA